MGIYISKNQDELFIVLNGEEKIDMKLCYEWDLKIRDFIIFGSENRKKLEGLKYNVIQLVLFQNDIEDRTEELSLNISRKIFLRCTINENGEIFLDSDEELEVPFYLIEPDDLEMDQRLIEKLKQYIPKEDSSLNFLSKIRKKANKKTKSFLKKEYDLIERWLTEDENRKD